LTKQQFELALQLFHGNHSTTYLVKPYQTVNIDLRSNQTSLLRSVNNSVFLAVLFGKSGVARDIEGNLNVIILGIIPHF